MSIESRRPVFLNLFRIRFPITAILSILHRISGLMLILILPFCLYILDISLSGPDGYQKAISIMRQPFVELVSVVAVWALAHHLFAGVRFLLLDLEFGLNKRAAHITAFVSMILAIILTAVYAWSLL